MRRLSTLLCLALLTACAPLSAERPLFTFADQSGPAPLSEGVWLQSDRSCSIEEGAARSEDCAWIEVTRSGDGGWRYVMGPGKPGVVVDSSWRFLITRAVNTDRGDEFAPLYVAEYLSTDRPGRPLYAAVAPVGPMPAKEVRMIAVIDCSDALREGPIPGVTDVRSSGQFSRVCIASSVGAVREAARPPSSSSCPRSLRWTKRGSFGSRRRCRSRLRERPPKQVSRPRSLRRPLDGDDAARAERQLSPIKIKSAATSNYSSMAYKNLVVFADGSEAGAVRVRSALDLARQSDAHVEARYLYGLARYPLEIRTADDRYNKVAGAERARAHEIVRALEAIEPPGRDYAVHSQSTDDGRLGQLASNAMHGADFALAALPEDDDRQREILEGALFASGAPCLALPKWINPHPWGQRILVAWKATPQAGRALAAALPFMARAQTVRLLVVNPRGALVGEDADGLRRLASRLLRHGVDVEAVAMNADDDQTGEAIADEATGFGADLLVMGAYGHSRLAEWTLGGVTRHMLQRGALPLLMAH